MDIHSVLVIYVRLLLFDFSDCRSPKKVENEVHSELGKSQRIYYLREQLKAIQKELGEGDDRTQEVDELREKMDAAGLPEEALIAAKRELEPLQRIPPASPEYAVAYRLTACATKRISAVIHWRTAF